MDGMMEIRFSADTFPELVKKTAAFVEKERWALDKTVSGAAQEVATNQQPMQMHATPTVPAAPISTFSQAPVAPANAAPFPTQQPLYQQPPTYQPPVQAPVQTAPAQVPSAAPGYQLEDLMRAGSALTDAGKGQAVQGLLAQFGVQAAVQLPPEQYGNFAAALRSLGAQL